MFIGPNLWDSPYKARTEQSTVEYILASHFDDVHIADLKESFENCLRTDSGNSLRAPFNFYNYRGINLSAPVADTDAATKGWTNDQIYRFESIVNLGEMYGNVALDTNRIYSMVQNGAIVFQLPTPTNTNVLNQIMIDFMTDENGSSIDFGTDVYVDKTPLAFAASNNYTIIYTYSNQLGAWSVGALLNGVAI